MMKKPAMLAGALMLAGCESQIPTTADILPSDTMIVSDRPVQFRVEVWDQNRKLIDNPMDGAWSASGPLRVSPDGVVTGTGYGDGAVTYVIEGVTDEATVRVNPLLRLSAEVAYINQAIQNPDTPLPLIPGRDGVLRLFVTVNRQHYYEDAPEIMVEVGVGSAAPEWDTIVSQGARGLLGAVDESDLEKSYNLLIDRRLVRPDMYLDITYDPHDKIDGIEGTETLRPEVLGLPEFELMIVPTISSRHPRPGIENWAEGLDIWDEKLWTIRTFLPVTPTDRSVTVHETFHTNWNLTTYGGWIRWLNHMGVMRRVENERDYYLGLQHYAGGGLLGIAYLGRPMATSTTTHNGVTNSHEVGHSMSLPHAPCGVDGPPFPYPDARIGQWGLDVEAMELVDPDVYRDHMSYCFGDPWTSDFFFEKAMRFRREAQLFERSVPVLMIWGDITDREFEPAFAFDAIPDRHEPDGKYLIRGLDELGDEVFAFRFTPAEISHVPGHEAFNLAIPYSPERDGLLSEVHLTGSGVHMILAQESMPATIIEKYANGQVRSIRELREGELPAPGSLVSSGLPGN